MNASRYRLSTVLFATTLCFAVAVQAGVPNLAAPTSNNLQQSTLNEQLHTLQEENQQDQITVGSLKHPFPGLPQSVQQNQMMLSMAQSQATQNQLAPSAMPSLQVPVQQEQMELSNPGFRNVR